MQLDPQYIVVNSLEYDYDIFHTKDPCAVHAYANNNE